MDGEPHHDDSETILTNDLLDDAVEVLAEIQALPEAPHDR